MNLGNLKASANLNLDRIGIRPSLFDHGFVIGTDESGKHTVQICWFMGHDSDSRNQVLTQKNDGVIIEMADPSKSEGASLPSFYVMNHVGRYFGMGNGDQTTDMINMLKTGNFSLDETLANYRCKYGRPGYPQFTAHVTCLSIIQSKRNREAAFSVLRKSDFDNTRIEGSHKYERIPPGYGKCMACYTASATEPGKIGGPSLVTVLGDFDTQLETYWRMLETESIIGVAVRFIDRETGVNVTKIKNKLEKVGF